MVCLAFGNLGRPQAAIRRRVWLSADWLDRLDRSLLSKHLVHRDQPIGASSSEQRSGQGKQKYSL
jgi:hypothetical protein